MTEHSALQVTPFSALAEVYVQAGFADFAIEHLPRYVEYAYSINWAGRRALDIGCGPGLTTWWLTQNGYRAAGIERNPHMLAYARQYVQAEVSAAREADNMIAPPELVEGDVRQLKSPLGGVDLVVAMNGVFNAIHSLRELEGAFQAVWAVLDPDKLFMFDLYTIRGLANQIGTRDQIVYDNAEDLTVVIRSTFSYETLTNLRQFMIYRLGEQGWQRQDELHVLKGYPVQGVAALLERSGFAVEAILNTDMSLFEVSADPGGRAVFVARKPA